MTLRVGVVALALLAACSTHTPPRAGIPVFDGHLDTLVHFVADDGKRWAEASSYDLTEITPGQVDLLRLRRGGVAGGLFTVAILDPADAENSLEGAIDILRDIERQSGGVLRLIADSEALEQVMRSGRIAAVPAIEGGDQIGESLAMLRKAYELGVRSMGLTWEKTNAIGDSNADQARHGGLSPFGREVVSEMNRLGMIIDLSHASQSTALDVLDVTKAPVILSHSSAAALCDTPRNASDDLLAAVARNEGVVMISFVPYLTSCAYRDWYLRGEERWKELEAEHGENSDAAQAAMKEWEQLNPAPVVDISMVADHLEHVRAVAGIESIGLGSDFDGMYSHVTGLEDVSRTQELMKVLEDRGWTDAERAKLGTGNFLRVWKAVERASDRR